MKIKSKLSVLLLTILLCCCAQLTWAEEESASSEDNYYQNASLLQYETALKKYSKNGLSAVDNCFSTKKIIWNPKEFYNTYMPGTLSKTAQPINTTIVTTVGIGITMGMTFNPAMFLSPATLIVSAARFYNMVDACSNTYVVAPHEYFNQQMGHTCEFVNGEMAYTQNSNLKPPLTTTDIPFFYHCDPTYDPITDSILDISTEEGAKMYGRTYGYMGSGSEYCAENFLPYAQRAVSEKLVGRIIVEQAPSIFPIFRLQYKDNCAPDGSRWRKNFSTRSNEISAGRGMVAGISTYSLTAFYKKFEDTGKIKMCVGTLYTLFPVRVACGYIAPPGDENVIDPRLKAYVQDTRCIYLIEPRKDLKQLGNVLPDIDQGGASRKAAKKFLQSDFHVTSTVVGCIKDMLIKIFIKTQQQGYVEKPFFQVVQERFKQIVLAVLVLYMTIVGLKLMTSGEQIKRSEMIMMIIKLALVAYFSIGDAFYRVEQNGTVTGLFPQLINVTDELANMFLEAQNSIQAVSQCTYNYNGNNLIGENLYTGATEKTVGFNGVKTTLWDLVDCKLINYFNAGSCDFTPRGMVLMWIVSIGFIGTTGFILSIVSLIYCTMLLFIIFKFTHIFILSLMIITVLIFLAPLFIPFALFEVTKGIFQKWMTTILGYLLYPALLFAFMALMFATFDQIYYGDLKVGNTNTTNFNLEQACNGVDSIYCYTMVGKITNSNDACDLSNNPAANWLSTQKVDYVGSFKTLTPSIAQGLVPIVLRLMLFALLFFLFLGSVSQFLAALLSIQSLDGMAKGSMNAFDIIGGAARMGASTAKTLFKKRGGE
jgi:type IV secretion system protein VirB6